MKLNTIHIVVLLIGSFLLGTISAEPNGAVLYRNGKRLGHINVSPTAEHHYFGYLEGPAWENRYCAFRCYVDKDDRNALDIIGKLKEEPILQYFTDTTVDEHTTWPWGTDILKVNSSMGLGAFRLLVNGTWINPQIPETLDSLTVTIVDSTTATPTVKLEYFGWNIGGGQKITAYWKIYTSAEEHATHCELTIDGNFNGKVVAGMVNHKENTSNPNRSTITLTQQETPPLLATLGKQGGLSEGFDDTLLMAIFCPENYFDSFVKNGTSDYGMALKPDADGKVEWSIAYSWAREVHPLFRKSDWKEKLVAATALKELPHIAPVAHQPKDLRINDIATENVFSLDGKTLRQGAVHQVPGVYIVKTPDHTRSKTALTNSAATR